MSLIMAIFTMISAWLAIACAMLWGVLRIARRHQHHQPHVRPASNALGKSGRRPIPAH